jgi:hypothetical protein
VTATDELTVIFEEQRTHLRAVAYRLLGSVDNGDDAVQESWLRLEPSDVPRCRQTCLPGSPPWSRGSVSTSCAREPPGREALGAQPTGVPDELVTDPAAEGEHADAVGRGTLQSPTRCLQPPLSGRPKFVPRTDARQ